MSIKTQAPPATTAQPPVPSLAPADFFSAAESRIDQWRQLSAVVRAWQAAANRGSSEDARFTDAVELFGRVAPLEGFYAYPGPRLLGAIEQALADRNASICARLVQHVSAALLTGTYRNDAAAWDPMQEDAAGGTDLLPPDLQSGNGHRPVLRGAGRHALRPFAMGTRAARPQAPPPAR